MGKETPRGQVSEKPITAGYYEITMSTLARLAAREDPSPIRNITRTSFTKKQEKRRPLLVQSSPQRQRKRGEKASLANHQSNSDQHEVVSCVDIIGNRSANKISKHCNNQQESQSGSSVQWKKEETNLDHEEVCEDEKRIGQTRREENSDVATNNLHGDYETVCGTDTSGSTTEGDEHRNAVVTQTNNEHERVCEIDALEHGRREEDHYFTSNSINNVQEGLQEPEAIGSRRGEDNHNDAINRMNSNHERLFATDSSRQRRMENKVNVGNSCKSSNPLERVFDIDTAGQRRAQGDFIYPAFGTDGEQPPFEVDTCWSGRGDHNCNFGNKHTTDEPERFCGSETPGQRRRDEDIYSASGNSNTEYGGVSEDDPIGSYATDANCIGAISHHDRFHEIDSGGQRRRDENCTFAVNHLQYDHERICEIDRRASDANLRGFRHGEHSFNHFPRVLSTISEKSPTWFVDGCADSSNRSSRNTSEKSGRVRSPNKEGKNARHACKHPSEGGQVRKAKTESREEEEEGQPFTCTQWFHELGPGKERERPQSQAELKEATLNNLYIMGELRPTCRPSLLELLVLKGEFLLSSLLKPDPSVEDLGFRDLNDIVSKDETRCENEQVSSQLQGLKRPPLERKVRVCLFDGCKFVGNVHVFTAAKAVEEEDEPWVFINKGASRCLVQYNNMGLNLYLELNVCYREAPADSTQNEKCGTNQEATEITCAWAMLELPDSARDLDDLLMRTCTELPLFVGGIESPVEVDYLPAPPERLRGSVKKKGGQSSLLQLYCYKPPAFQRKYSRLLPRTILAANAEVPFLVMYRRVLLDTLLNEKSLLTGGAVFSPLIQLYPWMLNERGKHLQELFKEAWLAKKLEWPPNINVSVP